ncbi:MAG: hypothetical protein GF331_03785 [Chitinivibrionales bacterium]|nr:hypothetical protein [Chitinivibrionales bacterium]
MAAKHAIRMVICATVILSTTASTAAEKMMLLRFGALWPRKLLETDKPTAWDIGAQYGVLVDKKIGIGMGVDLLWNRTVDEKKVENPANPADSLYEITRRESSFMFPVYAFAYIDPFSRFIVHPAISFAAGYNSMIYNFDNEDELRGGEVMDHDPDGYYFGLYMKLAADALVNLGENSALLVGIDYQWANVRSAKTYENKYHRRDMGGIGLRAGVRVVL